MLTKSLISFIFKTENPEEIKNFRPTSLPNFPYDEKMIFTDWMIFLKGTIISNKQEPLVSKPLIIGYDISQVLC